MGGKHRGHVPHHYNGSHQDKQREDIYGKFPDAALNVGTLFCPGSYSGLRVIVYRGLVLSLIHISEPTRRS